MPKPPWKMSSPPPFSSKMSVKVQYITLLAKCWHSNEAFTM